MSDKERRGMRRGDSLAKLCTDVPGQCACLRNRQQKSAVVREYSVVKEYSVVREYLKKLQVESKKKGGNKPKTSKNKAEKRRGETSLVKRRED